MLTRSLFLAAAAGFIPAALGQTKSDCNPMANPPCYRDEPALGTTYTYNYASSKAASPEFDVLNRGERISYQDDGCHMRVQGSYDSPTFRSKFFIFWGKVEVVMKIAPGAGVVSSFYMQSDTLDEIDLEWLGGQPNNLQTNFFSKGRQDVYTNGGNHNVNDAVGAFHTYTIDWTTDRIIWSIDGAAVRTLTRASAGDFYPQTPMQIKFGPWPAGDPGSGSPKGTVDWAGGPINFSQGPFDMVIQSISITDYSTGAVSYRHTNPSGNSDAIRINGGSGASTPAGQSSTTTATTTSTSATTSTSLTISTSVTTSTSGAGSATGTGSVVLSTSSEFTSSPGAPSTESSPSYQVPTSSSVSIGSSSQVTSSGTSSAESTSSQVTSSSSAAAASSTQESGAGAGAGATPPSSSGPRLTSTSIAAASTGTAAGTGGAGTGGAGTGGAGAGGAGAGTSTGTGASSASSSAAAGGTTSAVGGGAGGAAGTTITPSPTPSTFVVVSGNATSTVQTTFQPPVVTGEPTSGAAMRIASPLLLAVAALFALL
ncbi:Beta-glucanase [Drechslerella dactyloides]|uniref:Beta-glucanase n=1 Tax=Drechslerella dactyloides TaxID=74499 RepID=A0AAD6J3F2_DREDA|nr:Beta-glucanase [Drechslerella dactyloides]